ncbi:unnamed protein product [Effrenium voratum]|nr:unnamed protein product [Effrenium voratum]
MGDGARVLWQSRWLLGFFLFSLGCAVGLRLERALRERLAFADHPDFRELARKIPNYDHVWFAWNLVDTNTYGSWLLSQERRYPINQFGLHILARNTSWQALCVMDSDGDGLSNGEELGDPCCRWAPKALGDFQVDQNFEYRRWMISHPAHPTARADAHSHPTSCAEDYDADQYEKAFRAFYFDRLQGSEAVDWNLTALMKLSAFAVLVVQLALWLVYGGLLADLTPTAGSPLSLGTRALLVALCFVYMDFCSGVIHLILDYAPTFLPVLGGLAGGFRYHHEDPTAILRISWFEYASHTHLLCAVVLLALRLAPSSRGLRFFWVWGIVWSHVFQSAHRWAHWPPDALPGPVRALQTAGLVLTHSRHMQHHQDLEKQFSILSGCADCVLDRLVRIVPAARYDLWCVFGVLWFFLPSFLDLYLRSLSSSSDASLDGQPRPSWTKTSVKDCV